MNYDDEDDYDPTTNIPKPAYSGTLESEDGHAYKRIKVNEQNDYRNSVNHINNYGHNYGYCANTSLNPQPFTGYGQHMQQMSPHYNSFQWNTPQQSQLTQQSHMQAIPPNFGYLQTLPLEGQNTYGNYGAVNSHRPYIETSINEIKFDGITNENSKLKGSTIKVESRKVSQNEIESVISNEKSNKKSTSIFDDSTKESNSLKANKILIPGTTMTLESDEDIKKWKEERRKMWLLRISNRRKEHMEKMGLKEEDIKKAGNPLRESKKEQQFIKNIQAQVTRSNPKANLDIKLVQRGFAEENAKLLDFIVELGDCGFLDYELTQEEKDKLFGASVSYNGNNNHNNNKTRRPYHNKSGGNGESRYKSKQDRSVP